MSSPPDPGRRPRRAWRAALALAVAAAAVGAVLLLEVGDRPSSTGQLVAEGAVLESLVLEHPEERLELRPAGDGSWSLTSSVAERDLVADVRAVDMLADAIATTRVEPLGSGPATAAHGLDPPFFTLTLRTGETRRVVGFGRSVPGDPTRLFATVDGQLSTVPVTLGTAAQWGLAHFRSKTLLRLDWSAVTELVLERGADRAEGASEVLRFERDTEALGLPGAWRLTAPVDAPALHVRMEALVSKIGGLQAAGFGAERPGSGDLLEAGLAPPAATVRLGLRDGGAHALVLGARDEERNVVWARVDAGPLVEVRGDLLDNVLMRDELYRDLRAVPLPRWKLERILVDKPSPRGDFVLELSRREGERWRAVRPAASAPLPPEAVERFLEALTGVLFGRLEDALARDPERLARTYEFSGPGAIRMEVDTPVEGGAPFSVTVQLPGPDETIARGRGDYYLPVKVTDRAGRVTVGIVRHRAFDPALERAKELRDLVLSTGSP